MGRFDVGVRFASAPILKSHSRTIYRQSNQFPLGSVLIHLAYKSRKPLRSSFLLRYPVRHVTFFGLVQTYDHAFRVTDNITCSFGATISTR
jgi:hypothetical protein